MMEEGPRALALRAGALRASMIVIVPRGTWHRFETPNGATLERDHTGRNASRV
jgi:hypothetical protein